MIRQHPHRDAQQRASAGISSALPIYAASGPSITQAMKLTSKYKNADNSVGQCPVRRNSRQFMSALVGKSRGTIADNDRDSYRNRCAKMESTASD